MTAISRFGGRQVYELLALQEQVPFLVIRQIQLNRMHHMDMSLAGAESLRLVAVNGCLGSQFNMNLAETRSDVISSDDYIFLISTYLTTSSPIEFNSLGNS